MREIAREIVLVLLSIIISFGLGAGIGHLSGIYLEQKLGPKMSCTRDSEYCQKVYEREDQIRRMMK